LDLESGQSDVYNMFEAVVDVVHGRKARNSCSLNAWTVDVSAPSDLNPRAYNSWLFTATIAEA